MKSKYKYEEIIRESLGNKYIYNSEHIKEEQCIYCEKRNSKKCRLNIQNDKCINYMYGK